MYRWKSINGITLGCLIAHGDKDHLKYKKKKSTSTHCRVTPF